VVRFTLQPLYPQEITPVTHWIGDLVGPRAVLDAMLKKKFPTPVRNLNLELRSSVAQHYID